MASSLTPAFAALLSLVAVTLAWSPAQAADGDPVASALGDPRRPEVERARDNDRKPTDMVAFAGIKPGAKVVDFIPGTGYFTRIFAGVAGATGKVYAFVPSEIDPILQKRFGTTDVAPIFSTYENVAVVHVPVNTFSVPETVDVVWMAQNYHDLHDAFMGPADLAKVNQAIFKALKPGGVYIVLDHSAAAGSGLRETETLHRIDEASVRQEVEAAGFKFVGASDVLRNPDDKRDLNVFKPEIRAKTDQFILKFQKPKS